MGTSFVFQEEIGNRQTDFSDYSIINFKGSLEIMIMICSNILEKEHEQRVSEYKKIVIITVKIHTVIILPPPLKADLLQFACTGIWPSPLSLLPPIQGCHEIRLTEFKDNSRMFQGSFRHFEGCYNVEEMPRSGADSRN